MKTNNSSVVNVRLSTQRPQDNISPGGIIATDCVQHRYLYRLPGRLAVSLLSSSVHIHVYSAATQCATASVAGVFILLFVVTAFIARSRRRRLGTQIIILNHPHIQRQLVQHFPRVVIQNLPDGAKRIIVDGGATEHSHQSCEEGHEIIDRRLVLVLLGASWQSQETT